MFWILVITVLIGWFLANVAGAFWADETEGPGCLTVPAANIVYLGAVGLIIMAFNAPRYIVGFLLVLLLFAVLGAIVMFCVQTLFRNEIVPTRDELRYLEYLRIGVAVAVTGYLAIAYGPTNRIDGVSDFLMALIARFFGGAAVVVPMVLVIGLGLALCAPAGHRGRALTLCAKGTSWNGPLLTVGLMFLPVLVALAGVFIGNTTGLNMGNDSGLYDDVAWYEWLPVALGTIIIMVLVIVGLIAASLAIGLGLPYLAVARMFQARQAHPLLPALLGPWFVIGTTAFQFSDDTDVIATPDGVGALISATAIVVTVGISAYEYRVTSRDLLVTPFTGPPEIDEDAWRPHTTTHWQRHGAANHPAKVTLITAFLAALTIAALGTMWFGFQQGSTG